MDPKSLISPLLTDSRLTMPDVTKIAGGPITGLARAAGAAVGHMQGTPGAMAAAAREGYQGARNLLPKPTNLLGHAAQLTRGRAASLGGSLGALGGFVAPGTEYDENGNPHHKSRIMGALAGGAVGAGTGFLAAPAVRGVAGEVQKMHSGGAALPPEPAVHGGLPPEPAKLSEKKEENAQKELKPEMNSKVNDKKTVVPEAVKAPNDETKTPSAKLPKLNLIK